MIDFNRPPVVGTEEKYFRKALENGKLCGDVDYDSVESVVAAITPVPGGVGSVTTSVLVAHVVEAAARAHE